MHSQVHGIISMSYQDSLLINTFSSDLGLAIVPDIYSRKRNRTVAFEGDFLDLLYEQGEQQQKRNCRLPTSYFAQSESFSPAFLGMQQVKDAQAFTFGNIGGIESQKSTSVNTQTHTQEAIRLIVVEEPEQFYRARYDSEGVRAPLKGISENYPTVELKGEGIKHAVITVKLVHEDGSPHTCCSLDSSDADRKKGLSKKISPVHNTIKAEFEDLRIRREKKKEGRKSASSADKTGSRDTKCDKMAYLLFTAEVEATYGHITTSVISNPISLTAAPEPAELDWLVPTRGHFGGKEVVAIKGSKMTSPKVLFQMRGMNGELIELPGAIDKEKSHQNVLLIRTPIIDHHTYGLSHQCIEAKVMVITGRNQMCSNTLDFEFIPNDICRECMQETRMPPAQSNPCPPPPTNNLTVGLSPCSPVPLVSPRIQRSPGPVYSPPTFVQTGLPSPASNYDQFDRVPLTPSVQHSPLTISRDTGLQPAISCENFDNYGASPAQEMNTKEKEDILQIVEQLLSPVSSESNAPPPYSCPDVMPLYTSASCDSTPSEVSNFPDMMGRLQEALRTLQAEGAISPSDYMFYDNLRTRYNVDLLKAFSTANGDLFTFQQQLASFKPPTSYHSTHQ